MWHHLGTVERIGERLFVSCILGGISLTIFQGDRLQYILHNHHYTIIILSKIWLYYGYFSAALFCLDSILCNIFQRDNSQIWSSQKPHSDHRQGHSKYMMWCGDVGGMCLIAQRCDTESNSSCDKSTTHPLKAECLSSVPDAFPFAT